MKTTLSTHLLAAPPLFSQPTPYFQSSLCPSTANLLPPPPSSTSITPRYVSKQVKMCVGRGDESSSEYAVR